MKTFEIEAINTTVYKTTITVTAEDLESAKDQVYEDLDACPIETRSGTFNSSDTELKEVGAHEPIEWTRINNDVNGNPRYVCHYLNFIKSGADREISEKSNYLTAISRAKKLSGRKFHNKQYGGGIVFQSYNIKETEKQIHELMKQY